VFFVFFAVHITNVPLTIPLIPHGPTQARQLHKHTHALLSLDVIYRLEHLKADFRS